MQLHHQNSKLPPFTSKTFPKIPLWKPSWMPSNETNPYGPCVPIHQLLRRPYTATLTSEDVVEEEEAAVEEDGGPSQQSGAPTASATLTVPKNAGPRNDHMMTMMTTILTRIRKT